MKCPFCSYTATRHFDHQNIYWFCNHCWQKVPEFDHVLAVQSLSSLIQRTSLVEHIKTRTKVQEASYKIPHSVGTIG